MVEDIANNSYFPIYKRLIKLGVPVLVTQLGVVVVSFADTMMVGKYGLEELAASAFVNSLFLVVIVMLMGFAGGVTPLIGALYGKGEHEEGGITLKSALIVNMGLAFAFSIIMLVLYFFLDKFGQDEELLPLAKEYYLIIFFTLFPMVIFNCFQQACNGTTDTRTPMWIIILADILNIIGNYCLIFGKWGFPELGLAGAGWSTLIARVMAAIGIIIAFRCQKRYDEYRTGVWNGKCSREHYRLVWNTSYPLMIQSGVECGLWSFGAVVSGWFGKVQLAAYQVMNTIGQLGFMIYMGFGWATSILVANFTGKADYLKVRQIAKAGLHIILVLATLSSIVFALFTEPLVHVFTPSGDVAGEALLLVIPLILYQYCDGVQLTYVNAIRGTSVVKPLLWISLVSYICVGIPFLYLLAVVLDLETMGVYYSFSGALLSAAILLVVTFRKIIKRKLGESYISYGV